MQTSRVPPALGSTEVEEGFAAVANNGRNRAESLNIIKKRRQGPCAGDGRERRLHARNASLAFNRIEQRRLLSAFVSAGAGMRVKIEIPTSARDVLAQITLCVRFFNRAIHRLDQVPVFAANINIADMCIDRQTRDQNAFDHLVRIVFHQQAIFAGAGFAFIGVDDDDSGLGRGVRDEAPLEAGREIQRRRGRAARKASPRR